MEHSKLANVIERHPAIVSGEWVFKGTRVPLAALFENLKDGASVDDFLDWFPGVKREQIMTILDHELAARLKSGLPAVISYCFSLLLL